MQGGPKTQDINVREAFWWNDTSKNVYFKEAKNPGDLITTKASPGEELQLNLSLIIQILHITYLLKWLN
ncbi:hypothetical protein [Mycoplasmopsis cynos]|uniref:hypothetical protein n=1 Tax=Mycoplasmopsis cynos TaxID=171284 RepID=UPI0021FACCF8|nr:hypothetical protein [Mycoplasmopsis cynos]UWV92777.1 hypothetical protein NWE57_01710 [Mycoplasmopsis cynos]